MKKLILRYSIFRLILENIRLLICLPVKQINSTPDNNSKLRMSPDNLFTAFPQKLWKTLKSSVCLSMCVMLLSLPVLFSCSSSKSAKKSHPALDNKVISMTEDEVRKKLGEPTMASKTPENNIIWTYRPSWKILPDNKDTIYIEFENGRGTKIINAR